MVRCSYLDRILPVHVAQARREQELSQLVLTGLPLRQLDRSGHWTLGSLHIFTASGRWFNEQTGRRGRLGSDAMSRIVEREYFNQLGPYAQLNEASISLLFADLNLGLTFLKTAQITSVPETKRRCENHAAKAYRSVVQRASKLYMPSKTREALNKRLLLVESQLNGQLDGHRK